MFARSDESTLHPSPSPFRPTPEEPLAALEEPEQISAALEEFQKKEQKKFNPPVEPVTKQLTPDQGIPVNPQEQKPKTSKMSEKNKCTYEDCFKHFKTEQAMKRHKEKDPDHFYCKRCDVDCEDDTEYLIHQIISPKHIACPICGTEFEGTSARDLHVEVKHKKKQALKCVGCGITLTGASTYIAHIAKGECEVITLEAFDRLRAEHQIEKDAWDAALDAQNITYGDCSNLASNADTNGGALLMDDDCRGTTNRQRTASDLDSRISPLEPVARTSQQLIGKLASSMADLSVHRYPPLPPQSKSSQSISNGKNTSPKRTLENEDLISFDGSEVAGRADPQKQQQGGGVWRIDGKASSSLFAKDLEEKMCPSQGHLSGISNNGTRTKITHAIYGNDTNIRSSSAATDRTPIPPAARPVNTYPNDKLRGVQTATRVIPLSHTDPTRFWDDVREKFVCTGRDCKRHFDTAEGFKAHLVTDAHVGGITQCPSCLKKFATTWSLIAHCESPSRRCRISKSADYNQILRELTAGLLGTEGHTEDGTGDVKYVANQVDDWVGMREEKKEQVW